MASSLTLISLLFFVQGSLGYVLQQSPIVGIAGGHPVNIEDAPFMAVMAEIDRSTNMTYFKCGGSIIHQQFVLTAAHCLMFSSNPLIVRVGSSQLDDGKLYEVDKHISHENFHGEFEEFIFDVALLKLSEPLTLGSSVKIIKLTDETFNIPVGLTANVTGWGDTENMTEWKGNLLQVVVSVSPAEECALKYFNETIPIDDVQLCIKNKHKGFCNGDSGGPLTVGDHQIGIISLGIVCKGQPNIVVKIAPYLQWIHDKIHKNLLL